MLVLSKENAFADKPFFPEEKSFKHRAKDKIRRLSQTLAPNVQYKLAITDKPHINDVLIATRTNVIPFLVFNSDFLRRILSREEILSAYIAHELSHVIVGPKPGLIQYFLNELRTDRTAAGLLKKSGFSRISLIKIILSRLSTLIWREDKDCWRSLSIFLNILRLLNILSPI